MIYRFSSFQAGETTHMRQRWVHSNTGSRRHRRNQRQLEFPFRPRGGARKNAGRKPKVPRRPGARPNVPHLKRPALAGPLIAHVTLRLRPEIEPLRKPVTWQFLEQPFLVGGDRFGLRLCHYSIQTDHLHLIVEAADRKALTRGIQGLTIRIARAINRLMQRRGKVFADRYHAHLLSNPREVRNSLHYVLNNARKHCRERAQTAPHSAWIDPYSSAAYFDGWSRSVRPEPWWTG